VPIADNGYNRREALSVSLTMGNLYSGAIQRTGVKAGNCNRAGAEGASKA
jgi:hypothetical protein